MKILMCADGSEMAKNAIYFAGFIAKGLDADVVILHVIEKPDWDHSKDILRDAKDILEKHGIRARTKTRRGSPDLKIIEEAKKGYDLVVLGSHGVRSIKKFLFGDVADRVINHVSIPVLIVRGKRRRLKRILICSGGSKYAFEAIKFGIKIAKAIGAKVTLLHVIPEIPGMFKCLGIDEDLEEFLKTDTPEARILKKAARMLENEGIETQVELRHGFPPEEILEKADRGGYDMIVIGSHGMFGIRRIIMGAVASKVVQHVKIPCLLVKPKEFRFLSSIGAYDKIQE